MVSEQQLGVANQGAMSDPSEIIPSASVGMEHVGSRKKGRSKSREPSQLRSELGDVETRLAKVELKLVDEEEKFEEMEAHLEGLDERVEEFRGEVQGALNAAIDKLASEGETVRHTLGEEMAALKEENRTLREELEQAIAKLGEVSSELVVLKKAMVQGMVASPSTSIIAPSRVEVPNRMYLRDLKMQKKLIISYGA